MFYCYAILTSRYVLPNFKIIALNEKNAIQLNIAELHWEIQYFGYKKIRCYPSGRFVTVIL